MRGDRGTGPNTLLYYPTHASAASTSGLRALSLSPDQPAPSGRPPTDPSSPGSRGLGAEGCGFAALNSAGEVEGPPFGSDGRSRRPAGGVAFSAAWVQAWAGLYQRSNVDSERMRLPSVPHPVLSALLMVPELTAGSGPGVEAQVSRGTMSYVREHVWIGPEMVGGVCVGWTFSAPGEPAKGLPCIWKGTECMWWYGGDIDRPGGDMVRSKPWMGP